MSPHGDPARSSLGGSAPRRSCSAIARSHCEKPQSSFRARQPADHAELCIRHTTRPSFPRLDNSMGRHRVDVLYYRCTADLRWEFRPFTSQLLLPFTILILTHSLDTFALSKLWNKQHLLDCIELTYSVLIRSLLDFYLAFIIQSLFGFSYMHALFGFYSFFFFVSMELCLLCS